MKRSTPIGPSIVTASTLLLTLAGCSSDRGQDQASAGGGASLGTLGSGDSSGTGEETEGGGNSGNSGNSGGNSGNSGGTSGNSGGTSGGDSDGGASGPPKFDIATDPDLGDGAGCGGGGGAGEGGLYSYIWIANSPEGTVSKIDTTTGTEVGRYWTDPSQGGGSPSRTSVNLLGDMAVSNRNIPSTTKIAGREERCVDLNGNGVIETSTGPADVKAWGSDECVLWHTTYPNVSGGPAGTRPTQWEGKKNSEDPCDVDANPRLWIAYEDNSDIAHFSRLDGNTGTVVDDVTTDWNAWGSSYGPYGGVVNARGDLFVNGLGDVGHLLYIDALTLELTDHGNPGVSFYGIGIDADGNPWLAGGNHVSVFDDLTKQWTTIQVDNSSLRGIQIDREGRAWAAGNAPCGLVQLDVATRTVVHQQIDLPGCVTPVGVSIDIDGFVWSPDQSTSSAFKLDPVTLQVVLEISGLVSPYTYSDMTGAGLGLVVDPPPG